MFCPIHDVKIREIEVIIGVTTDSQGSPHEVFGKEYLCPIDDCEYNQELSE